MTAWIVTSPATRQKYFGLLHQSFRLLQPHRSVQFSTPPVGPDRSSGPKTTPRTQVTVASVPLKFQIIENMLEAGAERVRTTVGSWSSGFVVFFEGGAEKRVAS